MIIEKSPHHISNSNKIDNLSVIDNGANLPNPTKSDSDEFSFWSWFKGLVNPLQNLPIVSGIYSSVNSENEDSDRDLVQNSLGGFLYGGPIGAIVGFGNWAFNKIFDKTPTEMALDASGISEIWKDDKLEHNVNQIANATNPLSNDNFKLHIQYASNTPVNLKYSSKKTSNQEKIASLSDSLIKDNRKIVDERKLEPTNINKDENISENLNLVLEENLNRETQLKSDNMNLNKEIGVNFREINFSYPAWKPNEKIKTEKNIEFLKKRI